MSSHPRLAPLAVAVIAVVLAPVLLGGEGLPYVVTAIDYHFHDAHPTFPIGPGTDLVVKNAGRNVHNVTIPALGYSRNVRPGGRIVVQAIADVLDAGRYALICRIHEDRGMSGVIVIAEG